MGDPSSLRFVPASSSTTPIDWTRVPEATKKFIKQYGYDRIKKEHKPLPTTIGDLAKMFDQTKFFGYFKFDTLTALMDISEFGLQPTPQTLDRALVGPRFYMTYLEQVCFLLFAPGTRKCIAGYSEDTNHEDEDDSGEKDKDNNSCGDDGNDEDDDNGSDNSGDEDEDDAYEKMAAEEYEKMAAAETAMAQAFDIKLEQEVSQGKGELVEFTKRLGGWTAMTLQSSLRSSHYTEAIMALPTWHPASRAFVEGLFRSLGSQ